jgi:hypothetical protein
VERPRRDAVNQKAAIEHWNVEHIPRMAKSLGTRLLEVKLIALLPAKWEWQVCESDVLIMSGYETSRETAQIEGNSALFYLLRCPM